MTQLSLLTANRLYVKLQKHKQLNSSARFYITLHFVKN